MWLHCWNLHLFQGCLHVHEISYEMALFSQVLGQENNTLPKKTYYEEYFVLPALLQKLVGDFFGLSVGKIGGKLGGLFSDLQKTAQKYRGKIWSLFRAEVLVLKKSFHANFVLQTCHTPCTFRRLKGFYAPRNPKKRTVFKELRRTKAMLQKDCPKDPAVLKTLRDSELLSAENSLINLVRRCLLN